MYWPGAVALVCFAVHGGFHVLRGEPEDLLWACHLGAVLVGVGLLARRARVNAVGTLWLALGTPLWLLDLAAGGEFFPTSLLTHVVALAIGIYGVRKLGVPAGVWWQSAVALLALIALCRFVTPERANVNVAFAVPPPWQHNFPSHSVYLATMMTVAAAYFFALERVLRLWARPASATVPAEASVGREVGV